MKLKFPINFAPFPRFFVLYFATLVFTSCLTKRQETEMDVYNIHCAGCHIAPKIGELPKAIWEKSVLPNMFARMEVEDVRDNEYKGPFTSKTTEIKPKISLSDMILLEQFILGTAPETLVENAIPDFEMLASFDQIPIALDSANGSQVSFLAYSEGAEVFFGTASGALNAYNFQSKTVRKIFQGYSPVTWFNRRSDIDYITEVGILDPSERQRGLLVTRVDEVDQVISDSLHRPVHTLVQDLNKDGKYEIIICEFGNETGKLSMLVANESGQFEKTTLLTLSGSIRTVAEDMNNDGKLDLVVLTSQAWEGITILYQNEAFEFSAENVIGFSPIYGSSWFELVDYNKDGFMDIITVNGDNADKSFVQKPYHGMRIHLNDGTNNFEEVFFYPLNGVTRVVNHDFDEDGDLDFALLSSFPDYERAPQMSFVYLENMDFKNFTFKTKVLSDPDAGRWFLMDKGDIDEDGDIDIILSAFDDTFSPTPKELSIKWAESKLDLLVLKNKLK